MSPSTVRFGGGNVKVAGCFSAYTTSIICASFFSHALWSWSVLQGAEWAGTNAHWLGFTLDSSSCPSTSTFEACSSASEHVSSVEVEEKKYTRMMKMANLDTIMSTTASSWSPLVPKLSQHVWDVEGFANTGGNNENPVRLQEFQMWCSPAGGNISRLPMLLLLCSWALFLIELSYN